MRDAQFSAANPRQFSAPHSADAARLPPPPARPGDHNGDIHLYDLRVGPSAHSGRDEPLWSVQAHDGVVSDLSFQRAGGLPALERAAAETAVVAELDPAEVEVDM